MGLKRWCNRFAKAEVDIGIGGGGGNGAFLILVVAEGGLAFGADGDGVGVVDEVGVDGNAGGTGEDMSDEGELLLRDADLGAGDGLAVGAGDVDTYLARGD